jgi:2-keto-4-pentenoate hydratase/2-oxohepta-3-ene-1,7-dioic acid hydratase in catechol pathway
MLKLNLSELDGSGITNQWLKNGDEINLDIERLGQLKNTIKHYEP